MGGKAVLLAIALVLAASSSGCRTPKPDLKPPKEAEVLNMPTAESRFDNPEYPKQAMNSQDPTKRILDSQGPLTPTKGITSQGLR